MENSSAGKQGKANHTRYWTFWFAQLPIEGK